MLEQGGNRHQARNGRASRLPDVTLVPTATNERVGDIRATQIELQKRGKNGQLATRILLQHPGLDSGRDLRHALMAVKVKQAEVNEDNAAMMRRAREEVVADDSSRKR